MSAALKLSNSIKNSSGSRPKKLTHLLAENEGGSKDASAENKHGNNAEGASYKLSRSLLEKQRIDSLCHRIIGILHGEDEAVTDI